MAIKYPHCGFTGEIGGFKLIKSWRFRFYTMTILECLKCDDIYNYHKDVLPRKGIYFVDTIYLGVLRYQ